MNDSIPFAVGFEPLSVAFFVAVPDGPFAVLSAPEPSWESSR